MTALRSCLGKLPRPVTVPGYVKVERKLGASSQFSDIVLELLNWDFKFHSSSVELFCRFVGFRHCVHDASCER